MADCTDVRQVREALHALLNSRLVLAALAHASSCCPCCSREAAPDLVMAAYLLSKAAEFQPGMVEEYSTER